MKTIDLSLYGLDLSGREFGQEVYQSIIKDRPIQFDFSRIGSIGSSFADEVIGKISNENGGQVAIKGANRIVKKCLMDMAEDLKIEITFIV
jgi:hypothetical protein